MGILAFVDQFRARLVADFVRRRADEPNPY
jgi:hypothetical protein